MDAIQRRHERAVGDAFVAWHNQTTGTSHEYDAHGSDVPDLIYSVNLALTKKSGKAYPSGCVLVVAVYPDLTAAEEFALLMPEIRVPDAHPFAEIYVGGLFPAWSGGSEGGYSWWKLSPA
jgi:hypothetical protein